MPLTPDADGTHVCIFESFQLEGLHVGDLPCGFKVSLVSISPLLPFIRALHSLPEPLRVPWKDGGIYLTLILL